MTLSYLCFVIALVLALLAAIPARSPAPAWGSRTAPWSWVFFIAAFVCAGWGPVLRFWAPH